MLKEAIQQIASMAGNQIHEIEGKHYSEKGLTLIEPPRYIPKSKEVYGLDGLVNIIKAEIDKQCFPFPVFVEVQDYNNVVAFSTYNDRFERQTLYGAHSPVPEYRFSWKPYNEAMIAFRSQFVKTDDIDYILNLLSSIKDENSVKNEDNGLSQTVEVKQGIAIFGKAQIKPIVKLKPYRTFMEIEQPESEFLLRLEEGGKIGLFEADGGMWKLEAKKRITADLKCQLQELIEVGKVIVMY